MQCSNPDGLAMMRNLPAAAQFVRSSIGGGYWQQGQCPTPIGSGAAPTGALQQSCASAVCRTPARRRMFRMPDEAPGRGPAMSRGYAGEGEGSGCPGCGGYAGYGIAGCTSCGGAGRCGGGCAPSHECGCYDCRNAYGWASRYWGYKGQAQPQECPSTPYAGMAHQGPSGVSVHHGRKFGYRRRSGGYAGGCAGACITPGY